MTTDPIETLLRLVVDRLRDDAALRDALRSALLRILELPTSTPSVTPAEPPPSTPQVSGQPDAPTPRAVAPPSLTGPIEILPPLTFAKAPAAPPPFSAAVASTDASPSAAFDLKLMTDRFALKRDGCEWHIERRRLLQQGGVDFRDEIDPRDKEIMDRARALPGGCWMWMCQPSSPTPEPELMDLAARAYDNLARAALLSRDLLEDERLAGRHDDTALTLLAEALSATRVILERIDAPPDRDHKQTFEWLRGQTATRDIFIARHMKLDDPADPADWNDLSERIHAIQERVQHTQTTQQQQKQLLNTIRFHCQKLTGAGSDEAAGHWGKIIAACTQLVQAGVPPSNTQLRDLLLPAIEQLPGEQPATAEFDQVLRSIDAHLASREAEAPEPPAQAPSADVLAVRGALAGRAVLLIGGIPNAAAREKLRETLDLSEVLWPETRVHESHYNYEAAVRRPDVAVVLLAIRWSNHGFGDVKAFCDAADKPMVRLPAGYGPNSVAHAIVDQAGKRLGLTGS